MVAQEHHHYYFEERLEHVQKLSAQCCGDIQREGQIHEGQMGIQSVSN